MALIVGRHHVFISPRLDWPNNRYGLTKFMNYRCLALSVLIGLILPAAAHAGEHAAGDLTIVNSWARATIGKARSGAAYLTVVNKGRESDRLVAVVTPVARKAEIHAHEMKDGIMKMRPTGPLKLDAGATVSFKPGGMHVMLMGLKRPLKEGEAFPLTLTFEKSGTVTLDVAVRHFAAKRANARPRDEGHMKRSGTSTGHGEGHHGSYEIAQHMAPEISIQLTPDTVGGWNLHLKTTRFRFSPEKTGSDPVAGEGHAHLFVNGKKIARLYGAWFHIATLPEGKNRIDVGLYTNDHRAVSVEGTPVKATVTVTVPGA